MNTKITQYLKFGKYTADCPQALLDKIPRDGLLNLDNNTVHRILKIIKQEFDPKLYKITTTHDLKTSRFISAQDILDKRQRSCGSMATVVASVFRHLGVPTKLIDGKYIKDNPDMKHAWNEIYFLSQDKFVSFDITRSDFEITDWHIREGEYIDWEELVL